MSLNRLIESYLGVSDIGLQLVLLLNLILLACVVYFWRRSRRQFVIVANEKEVLQGDEQRMFTFLHDLGVALEKDHSSNRLKRKIVQGVVKVLRAKGGALYMLDDTQQFLVPKFVSSECPLLIGLPAEMAAKILGDEQALVSYVKLCKVPVKEGLLGKVLSSGVAQSVPDVKEHEAFRDALVPYTGDVAAMVSPLRYAGRDIGVIAVARDHTDEKFSENEYLLFQAAAEQAGFALGNALVHQEAGEKRKIDDELRTAREVQGILLPDCRPQISGYRVVGLNQPARVISGDYYDYIPLNDGRWAVVVADVSGKGIAAGLLMAMCRSVLRAELKRDGDAFLAVSRLNRQIYHDIREDSFISLAVYVINENDGKVQLVRAGHDKAPLLRKGESEPEWIKPPGMAIGLDEGDVFDRVTQVYEFEMFAGDSLLIYTDGVTEAHNAKEEEFGVGRMVDVMREAHALGAENLVGKMIEAVKKFVGRTSQADDITMIAVEKR